MSSSSYPIRRVAVLGAGVMGSGIAAHLANAGIPSVLFDMVPKDAGSKPAARNKFALAGIQTATIDGQSPSEEAIRSHKYPYARPTFFYTNGEPSGEAARFIEFVLSAEGQTIARKVGFVTRN